MTIIWADNAIQKQWLQVRVKANANTGLAADDVFYFGNSVGETGNSTVKHVRGRHGLRGRARPSEELPEPVPVDYPYDIDKNSFVDGTDLAIVRDNSTNFLTALKLIVAP